MEIHQLRTFIAVAREGSITRASERIYLSQPAVSAHIKAIEETLGVSLFARTARGMILTSDGQRLLAKAEETLGAHREFLEEATRIKSRLTGKLRIGGGGNSNSAALGRLMTAMSDRHPDVECVVQHGDSLAVLEGLRNGELDVGFYNEPSTPPGDLNTCKVSEFSVYLAAPAGQFSNEDGPNWQALADMPWIYPASMPSCCGHTAEALFRRYQFRPAKTISVDREAVTRTLIAGGVGVGLLHSDTAFDARDRGEVNLLFKAHEGVDVMFAHISSRENDPLIEAAWRLIVDATQGAE